MKTKKNIILGIGTAILLQACGGGEPQAQLNFRHRERFGVFFKQALSQAVDDGRSLNWDDQSVDREFSCDQGAFDFKGKILTTSAATGDNRLKSLDIELSSQPKACRLKTEDAAEIQLSEGSLRLTSTVEYIEEAITDPETGEAFIDPITGDAMTQIVAQVEKASLSGSVNIEGEGNLVSGGCDLDIEYERKYGSNGDAVAQTITGKVCGESVNWVF